MMRDSRGKKSYTWPLVLISWSIVTLKFLIGGITFGSLGVMPEMSAGEFGAAVVCILGIWLGRELTEKTVAKEPIQLPQEADDVWELP